MKFAFSNFKFKLLYNDMSGSSSDHTVFRESFSLATRKQLYTVSVWQKCIIRFFFFFFFFLRPLNAGGEYQQAVWLGLIPTQVAADTLH